jgi:hypothetical protein
MRLAFLMMPFVLVAEYVWFFPFFHETRHSWLLCVVLLGTASIPFISKSKDIFL